MYEDLSNVQIQLLEFLITHINSKGYPPSIREICTAMNYKSTSTAHSALSKLENLNYIKRDSTKTRAIEIIRYDNNTYNTKKTKNFPLVGQVTAGEPILAFQHIEEYIPLPEEWFNSNEHFVLKVKGDSMINAGIFDGDIIVAESINIARNNDIVVALIDGETATVKRYWKDASGIRLLPENEEYEPIFGVNIEIIGKVKTLIRLNLR